MEKTQMTSDNVTSSTLRYRILCVDDNEFGLYLNAVLLRGEGYDVVTCSNVEKAAAIVKSQEIDVAILDYQMPVMNGGELAAFCKAANPDIRVILYSGWLGIPKRELAVADLFIQKSEGVQALLKGIEALLPVQRPRSKSSVADNNAGARMEH
jgi:CheY-like chemotaxis protein